MMTASTVAFSIPSLIAKKRDSHTLTQDEIGYLVNLIGSKKMDKAQIGALLMTIRLAGMNEEETACLTRAMIASSHVFSWPDEWRHLVVDKHSTGGVGDKVSLVLAPALASCGLRVPMVSGRGLGHTGGTLDKLESIPKLSVDLTTNEIRAAVEDVGCCIVGQTKDLVPADKIMYGIRDVTATVDSLPLIAGSIVSKKAAEGLASLVLDVKYGKGAINTNVESASRMARSLVMVSNQQGIKTTALVTKMDSPLGYTVGNALEVAESIAIMQGREGHGQLVTLTCTLGGHLLYNVGQVNSPTEGAEVIRTTLRDGRAIRKFCSMLKMQGVDADVADALCSKDADVFDVLPRAKNITAVTATSSGYIAEINAMVCAQVCSKLGAAKNRIDDVIDRAVGLWIKRHVGDYAKQGDIIMAIHHNIPLPNDTVTTLQDAVRYQNVPVKSTDLELIYDVITSEN